MVTTDTIAVRAAVAALVVFAGCGALDAGSETGGDATTTTRPEPPPSLYDPPLNDSRVVAAHLDALRGAGSYTLRANTTIRAGGRTDRGARTVVRGDLATGRVLVDVRAGDRIRHVYRFANGTTYERSVAGGASSYTRLGATARNASTWATSALARALTLFHFSYAGTTDAGDETRHVYRAAGTGALDRTGTAFDEAGSTTVTSVNATLYVRPDGAVTRVAYRYSTVTGGGTTTVAYTGRFGEFGDTDASPPVWVATARNRTT
jgi:hypothetical protein